VAGVTVINGVGYDATIPGVSGKWREATSDTLSTPVGWIAQLKVLTAVAGTVPTLADYAEAIVLCDLSGGDFSLQLPSVAVGTNFHYYFVCSDSNPGTVTINTDAVLPDYIYPGGITGYKIAAMDPGMPRQVELFNPGGVSWYTMGASRFGALPVLASNDVTPLVMTAAIPEAIIECTPAANYNQDLPASAPGLKYTFVAMAGDAFAVQIRPVAPDVILPATGGGANCFISSAVATKAICSITVECHTAGTWYVTSTAYNTA
jgi:hypothetical protein